MPLELVRKILLGIPRLSRGIVCSMLHEGRRRGETTMPSPKSSTLAAIRKSLGFNTPGVQVRSAENLRYGPDEWSDDKQEQLEDAANEARHAVLARRHAAVKRSNGSA